MLKLIITQLKVQDILYKTLTVFLKGIFVPLINYSFITIYTTTILYLFLLLAKSYNLL